MTRLPHNDAIDPTDAPQPTDAPPPTASNDPPAEEEPQTMSLMAGVAGTGGGAPDGEGLSDADLLEIENGGSSSMGLSRNTLILIAVAVVGVGALGVMWWSSRGKLGDGESQEVNAKIDTALAKLKQPDATDPQDPLHGRNLQALFHDTKSIVAMFADDRSKQQVPVEYLKKNPFRLTTNKLVKKPEPKVDQAAQQHARRLKELRRVLHTLSLQTIMISSNRKLAVIDGEFYQPKQHIGPFTIKTMNKLSVGLTAEGETFTLTLDDQAK